LVRCPVQDLLPPPLRELGDGVRRVVGAHPGQHLRDLGVGAGAEQPGSPVLIKLLEDVRLKLGVGVYLPEDLGLLLLGRILDQVRDLRGLQPPDPPERAARHGAARMADQRLEPGPVTEYLPAGLVRVLPGRLPARAKQPEQPARPAARVHPRQHPLPVTGLQLKVGRAHQVRGLHVDQPVPEHVGPEQHLALAPLESPQVDPGTGEPEHLTVQRDHLPGRNEHLPAADRRNQADDRRAFRAAKPHDDIGKPPHRLTARISERAPQQLRQVQRARAARLRGVAGRRSRHHGAFLQPARRSGSRPDHSVTVGIRPGKCATTR